MLLYVQLQSPYGPLGTGSPGPPSGYIHNDDDDDDDDDDGDDDVRLNVLRCRADILRTHLLSTKHLERDREVKESPRGA